MVIVSDAAIDPYQLLANYEAQLSARGSVGAAAHFIGLMREFNEGDDVVGMTLEQYPEMTRRALDKLRLSLIDDFELNDALIVHRVGALQITDPIVVVGCWSAHRKAAFEACRAAMERLKSDVPLWKKETLADGSTRWVEQNTPGY